MLLPSCDIAGLCAKWIRITEPLLSDSRVELWLNCPTTAEPMISGNKWMKLQYHIKLIQQQQYRGFVTFGGAFSNHLAASAAAARLNKIKAIAYVRADRIDTQNPTMQYCLAQGMTLIATDRQTYRQRQQPGFLAMLAQHHPGFLLIPEGGSSPLGSKGVARLNLIDTPAGPADIIATATASGGTLAGLIMANNQQANHDNIPQIFGLAVLNDPALSANVQTLLSDCPASRTPWRIIATEPEQRYAKCPEAHIDFCCNFAVNHNVAIEPVYTGRALYKLYLMIAAGEIAPGSRISFFHTGGLQGLAGLYYRRLINQQQYQILSAARAG